MGSLVEYVRQNIDPRQYYESIFPGIKWPSTGSEPRVLCAFHKESTPSLHLNPASGAWYCHGCGQGGKSIVSFHAKYEGISTKEAAIELFQQFIHPTIDPKIVRRWHRKLKASRKCLGYIKHSRLLSAKSVERFMLGFDGRRITIPIRNEYGLFINAKHYDADPQPSMPKMVNHKDETEERSFGSPATLFPIEVFQTVDEEQSLIVVCEGEWDAMLLNDLGVPAVTSTGGCRTWPDRHNPLFRGLDVVILYDNDEDGEKYGSKIVHRLMKFARSIRRVRVPKKYGKDITDWCRTSKEMLNAEKWYRLIHKAKIIVENEGMLREEPDAVQVPLDAASSAQYFNQPIEVDALVTGKDTSPYLLPKKFRVSCSKNCEGCPLAETDQEFIERTVEEMSDQALELIDTSSKSMKTTMITMSGLPVKASCRAKVEVIETFNVERVLLIPTLDSHTQQYVVRPSYLIGHGIVPNRSYRFIGTTIPNPKNQHATHLFKSAHPVQGQIETFELSDEMRRSLQVFSAKRKRIDRHFNFIADWQSRHITKIKQRPDLHTAVDLAFHSVGAFSFNGEFIPRGMLDILILGDTRCGKGFVAERLARFYKLGDIASGENCSFAGLVGGCQPINNQWLVTWGTIPLNHNRLVIIDEASSLTEQDFAKMSRVRSEGVAEIKKIVHEQTQANTRLIWIANPRSGRPIMSYNSGAEAVKELVGNNEDISRFDFVITVASNEVPSSVINQPAVGGYEDEKAFDPSLFRSLVLWAWSRNPDQIEFTDAATLKIIDTAIDFGEQYSSNIPLVQAENIRIKLAKISAAVAARVFSCDSTGQVLVVNSKHVDFARSFLEQIYSKPSMGYDVFSRGAIDRSTIRDINRVADVFMQIESVREDAIHGLMQMHRVTADQLSDYTNGDILIAKTLISELVKLKCLTRVERSNWYYKNAAFNTWLRKALNKEVEDGEIA